MMAAVKCKNTSLEKLVFAEMKKRGVRFTKHYKRLPGTPDLALPQLKKVIFIDGDFLHGYRYPAWRKKITSEFWRKKIETNRVRDRRNFRRIRKLGWQVMRIWGHEIKKRPAETFQRIYDFISG
jgi:DNA mismatch endonuclease (patch repair protein)